MKRLYLLIIAVLFVFLCGCETQSPAQVAATTLPVFDFTVQLCQGTDISVTRLVTENVSCLHDFTLQVDQMKSIEQADLVVVSGAGLEEFLEDALNLAENVCDASSGLELLGNEQHDHEHEHEHEHEHGHAHGEDPHIWLSPVNAMVMAQNICEGLTGQFPEYETVFQENLTSLLRQLEELQAYGERELSSLSCRELITFHDGFSYLAKSFHLTILKAVEEESGSEASAAELIELIEIVTSHGLPAVFTEVNGSVSAAQIISAETGVSVFKLDMGMAGNSYFEAMYYNIDTIKEACQ